MTSMSGWAIVCRRFFLWLLGCYSGSVFGYFYMFRHFCLDSAYKYVFIIQTSSYVYRVYDRQVVLTLLIIKLTQVTVVLLLTLLMIV